jgi:hypothetical protein
MISSQKSLYLVDKNFEWGNILTQKRKIRSVSLKQEDYMRSWLPYVVLTILAWGTYIPTPHKGTILLGRSGVHAFLMVGLAYVVVAILIPGTMIVRAGSWATFTAGGSGFTFIAGALGAIGALGIVLAMANGGRPNVVPPLVFAGAPVVNVFVAMLYNPPKESPPLLFFLGILMAAAGAGMVLANRPS